MTEMRVLTREGHAADPVGLGLHLALAEVGNDAVALVVNKHVCGLLRKPMLVNIHTM